MQKNLLSTHNNNHVPKIALSDLLIIAMPLDRRVKNKENIHLIDV